MCSQIQVSTIHIECYTMLQTIPGIEEQVAIVKDLSRDNDRDITFTRKGIFVSNDLVVISLRLCVFRNAVYSMYCV